MELIFDESEDWEKRTLCSDESCIGTIGQDGRCKECGKVYEGELPAGHVTQNIKPVAEPENVQTRSDSEDDDWDKRILCSDESCIGVIGVDNKCRECGKPFK